MFVGFRYYIDESEYSEGIREHFILFCFEFLFFWFINLTTSSTLFLFVLFSFLHHVRHRN